MPLQIRRGSTAQRLTITPLPGEIIYDTTTGQLFVGDGTTPGGVVTTGIGLEEARDAAASLFTGGTHNGITFSYNDNLNTIDAIVDTGLSVEEARDAAAALFTNGTHSGITFSYNDELDKIDVTVTSAAIGSFDGDLTGSVFADDSTLLVDGLSGRLVGPLATSGLASSLNTNGFSITSNINTNIIIDPSGSGVLFVDGNSQFNGDIAITGNITKTGSLFIQSSTFTQLGNDTTLNDGNLIITRNTYSNSPTAGVLFKQHHNSQDAVNFTFYRTRGTATVPVALQDGDDIGEILFVGQSPGSPFPAGGVAITVSVDGTPTTGNVPSKISFGTDNGTNIDFRAELSASGIWRINSLSSYTTPQIIVLNPLKGDLIGSLFADDSSRIIDGTDGRINSPSASLSEFLKLPVYADDAARDAAIPVPEKGMVIMVESGLSPASTNQIEFFNGSNWVTL